MKQFFALSCFGTILMLSGAAASADQPLWKTVDSWQVRVDTTLNYGCFIYNSYERGTVLRMGFNRTNSSAYLMIGNDAWSSLESGKEYNLKIQFDAETPWTAKAVAVELGGGTFLWVNFKESSFILDIMKKQGVVFTYQNRQVANLSLKGSYKAGQEMLACQQAMNDGVSGPGANPKDPFAGVSGRPKSDDPFRNSR